MAVPNRISPDQIREADEWLFRILRYFLRQKHFERNVMKDAVGNDQQVSVLLRQGFHRPDDHFIQPAAGTGKESGIAVRVGIEQTEAENLHLLLQNASVGKPVESM